MTTFYYLAVSNSGNKRMAGEIAAANELAARAELNKLGLAVLSIATTPFPEMSSKNTIQFEFEGVDRYQKPVAGTIDARNTFAAFERLKREFGFTVRYICRVDASENEKSAARASSAAQLASEETRRAADEAKRNKPVLKLTLKELVERAETKIRERVQPKISAADEDTFIALPAESATTATDDMTTELPRTSAAEPEPVMIPTAAVPASLRLRLATEDVRLTSGVALAATAAEFTKDDFKQTGITALTEETAPTKLESIQLVEKSPLATEESFSIFEDTTVTESGVTAAAVAPVPTGGLFAALRESFAARVRGFSTNGVAIDWHAIFDPKVIATETFTLLTLLFMGTFFALHLLSAYQLGSLTTFAGALTDRSTAIAFFALAFLSARLSIALADRFTVDVMPRRVALYSLTTSFVVLVGLNVVY